MIEFKDVTKTYYMGHQAVPVLRGINFTIEKGELVAIMGASGSGKSTSMNIIGLLDHPTSGKYFLEGTEISMLNSDQLADFRNQTIGFIFQSFFLLPRLTALQNVGLPLHYRDMKQSLIEQRSIEILEKVGMGHLADHRPSQLSGGQQQRVAIARALVGKPSILLADEPTGALDSKTGADVMNLLITLNQEGHATVIIITHDPHVAEQCRRVIKISDGVIVSDV